ncbi:required for meiotic nuclear division protein 1 homolog isoform X1 [Vespula pensylvanica]|uniref:required for meiotic nuclear division protein 1 homolog isoform X1 n=1 Tax=Vespula pensylvanica TaxID=30213 RepID=UPI001CB9DC1D|nr:required for meiotic nuclear division protein 1 homolog isoform X1 [Vespula pensylvanica]
MSYAILHRLVLIPYRQNINFAIYRKVENVFMFFQQKITIPIAYSVNMNVCISYRSFYNKSQLLKNVIITNKKGIQENISTLQLKKRPIWKNKSVVGEEVSLIPGAWIIKALATAEQYNLESLEIGLLNQQLYIPHKICTSTNPLPDVIHAIAKYEVGHEARELYFFREGTIVMWNVSDLESGNILQFLKHYEENSYTLELIHAESELMTYTYTESGKKCHIKDGNIILTRDATNLEKYTFSNAIAQSVKLGIWETSLGHYINTVEFVTEDLRTGKKLQMSQSEVLRKQGELFALRHLINLSSDLLDTPDFYWERDDLESLYQQIYGYFNIAKRTKVMNEKLNHCVELVAILSSHLSDRHHIRLEWMIIVLIMVEVAFEILHYVDRYLVK